LTRLTLLKLKLKMMWRRVVIARGVVGGALEFVTCGAIVVVVGVEESRGIRG
jgi:hypothetical protein